MSDAEPDRVRDARATQHAADTQVLLGEIGSARLELARLKIAYYAATADIEISYTVKDVNGSREQRRHAINRHIQRAAANADKLQAMYESLSEGEPLALPEARLAVVTKK